MEMVAVEREWMQPGEMLLKHVGALAGDSYYVDNRCFYVNGHYIGPISTHDSQGQPLPEIRGGFVVKDGHFLPVAGRRPNSFDGRYVGEVSLSSIKDKVIPLIVFN
jgi:type IV secretory pathway protease TraF